MPFRPADRLTLKKKERDLRSEILKFSPKMSFSGDEMRNHFGLSFKDDEGFSIPYRLQLVIVLTLFSSSRD